MLVLRSQGVLLPTTIVGSLPRPAWLRGAVFRALRAEGIGVNVHYIPVHRHAYYLERFPGVSMPVAEAAYDRLLTVPLFASMTIADVDDVVAALDKVTTTYRAA